MTLVYRAASTGDVEALFGVRARTRENGLTRDQLAARGITPASITAFLQAGSARSRVCVQGTDVVGFCLGDAASGEVLVLAVLPAFEGLGVGRTLLGAVVDSLQAAGCRRLWLAASPDPAGRAFGFYRAQGWRPTGGHDAARDEILERDSG